MLQIDSQTALLVIQLITLLVTTVGWVFTGGQQKSILRESRQYQKQDRDILVYRTRMEGASKLTKSLIESSDKWYKLASFAKATLDDGKAQEFQTLALPLVQQVAFTKIDVATILYDPQFRTIRDLLQPEVGKKIYNALKASSTHIVSFHEKTYNMLPTDLDIIEQVRFIYEEGAKIGDELVAVADRFADAFAALDRALTQWA